MPIDRIIDVDVPVMWTQLANKGQQEQLKTVVLSIKTFWGVRVRCSFVHLWKYRRPVYSVTW